MLGFAIASELQVIDYDRETSGEIRGAGLEFENDRCHLANAADRAWNFNGSTPGDLCLRSSTALQRSGFETGLGTLRNSQCRV